MSTQTNNLTQNPQTQIQHPNLQNHNQNQQQQQQQNITSTPRLPNTTVCVPIVYGSIAFPLKKVEEYNTHRWTLYVRGPNNEDLSVGVAKVVFQLHPSFPQPVRELTAPPFEVTEKGWGEFEATIRIVWRDSAEKAAVLTHGIKLYPSLPVASTGANANAGSNSTSGNSAGGNASGSTGSKDGQPVVHEFYDEVVFTNPTESFHKQLLSSSTGNIPKIQSHETQVQENFQTYSDERDFKILLEAQKFLEAELLSVKDRILRADTLKEQLEDAIAEQTMNMKKGTGSGGSGGAGGRSSNAKGKSNAGGGSSSKKSKLS